MAGLGGQVVAGGGSPDPGVEVRRLEGQVAAAAELVEERVPLLLGVGLEHQRTFGGAHRPLADALGDRGPGGVEERVALLLEDELAVGRGGGVVPLVLRQTEVRSVVLDHRGVDDRVTAVDPHLGLAEGVEVAGRRVHHAVVRVAGVRLVVVQLRGPEDDVLAALFVVERLGRPGVARAVGGDLHQALVGPVHEVGGLPDHDGLAAGALGGVPVAVAVDPQVGGDLVELVALGGADDERVAQALLTERGGQDGLAVVQLPPFQRVVALAQGRVELLAVGGALAGEVAEHVALEGLLRGEFGDLGGEGAGRRGLALGDGRGQVDGRAAGAVRGAVDRAVGGDDVRLRGGPGDVGPVGAVRGEGEVAPYVVEVVDAQRLGGLPGGGPVVEGGGDRDVEGLGGGHGALL